MDNSADDDPRFEVPLAVLDDALEVPLTPEYIDRIDPDLALCERLYFALRDYHRRNPIQPIDRTLLRPNLSFVGPEQGVLVNTDFDGYRAGSYLPRNGQTTLPLQDIKRTLVFADALVVEDPVFAFARFAMCHRFQEAVPAWSVLQQALRALAAMRPLLEMRLLRLTAYFPDQVEDVARRVPRGAGGIAVRDVAALTSYQDPRVLDLVVGSSTRLTVEERSDPQARRLRVRALMAAHGERFEWLYRQAESTVHGRQHGMAYAPFLPNTYQFDIFAELRRLNARSGPHERLWQLAELNSGGIIDPDRIGFDELASIRLSDEVYAAWRRAVKAATKAAAPDAAFDGDAFRAQMREEQATWEAESRRYTGERLKDITTVTKQVSLGAIGGLVKGALHGEPSIEALSALLLGPVTGVHRELLRRKADLAMTGFFAAVRSTGPEPATPYDW